MNKLLSLFAAALFSVSAHAQAVNNRTFVWDAPTPVAGVIISGYRLYCGTTSDPTTFSPVKDVVGAAILTTGVVALADTIKFCALKAYSTTLESLFSNVVSVTAPNAPVIRVTTIDTFAGGVLVSHVIYAEIE